MPEINGIPVKKKGIIQANPNTSGALFMALLFLAATVFPEDRNTRILLAIISITTLIRAKKYSENKIFFLACVGFITISILVWVFR